MRAMICNFPSVFANEYKRIKPEKCAVEYPPRAFRAFSRPFFSPSIVSASTGDDTDTHAKLRNVCKAICKEAEPVSESDFLNSESSSKDGREFWSLATIRI